MSRFPHPTDGGIPFTREEFDRSRPEILHKGRWGNADMLLFRKGEETWVVKDFRACFLAVRHTWGAYMAGRELSALRRLAGIPGFPQGAFRLDRFSMAYRYVPGTHIGRAAPALLTKAFFETLETLVARMHERGVTHLDIRTGGNVLVTERGEPLILDFQSHVVLDGLPPFFRGLLIDVDRSGVYKHWSRWAPDSLGEERTKLLQRVNRLRRYWIIKGYLGIKSGQ